MKRIACVVALLAAAASGEDAKASLDKTGHRWTLPFAAAHAKAATEKRILVIKPIAFGTSPDGGW